MRSNPALLAAAAALLVALGAPSSGFALGTPPDSAAEPPATTNATTFDVPYTVTDNSGSGIAHVDLYAKGPTDLIYTDVGSVTPDVAAFSYSATEGDGHYSFYTVATDNDGDVELPPLGGPDGTTTLDTTPPDSSAAPPADSAQPTFNVPFTASDSGGSSVAQIELYAKGPNDSGYSKAGTAAPGDSSFSYTAIEGDGAYAFYTVATDSAGNVEQAPASPDGTTAVDTTPPASAAAAPTYANQQTFSVPFSASDGGGAGVARVDLYAKGPSDSGYAKAASAAPGASHFSYTAAEGDGSYAFYTVATDALGHAEAAPSDADSTTLLDTEAPISAASTPVHNADGSLTVPYSATDSGAGIASVELWVQTPGATSYKLVGTQTDPAANSFTYQPQGDGTYSFYTVAIDRAGNREQVPGLDDSSATVSSSQPSSPPPAGTTVAQLPPAGSQPVAPSSSAAPSLPLVAALTLPPHQTLRSLLRRGLVLTLYAYRPVTLGISLLVNQATAKHVGLGRQLVVGARTFSASDPKIYKVTVALTRRARSRLRSLRTVALQLRTTLRSSSGKSTTNNTVRLGR